MCMERYDHKTIEAKWQAAWQREQTFAAPAPAKAKRAYVLDMFPYPSAAGLHVGHVEGYSATDIYCRYLRVRGVHILHPMGWDAFGLPAENYAIKTGRHPRETTQENVANIKQQLNALGFSYDWSREVNTADPSYYRWTQWLFLKLYAKGLAYRKEAPVNWCPKDQTVLANEQVVDGACERCGATVEQRQMKQWFFKTTAYADRLLSELEGLDWPQPIVEMQKNWIGKSEGAMVKFEIRNPVKGLVSPHGTFASSKFEIEIFTTRLDTIFGATFLVISPELAKTWIDAGWQATAEIKKYVAKSLKSRELERVERAAKEKTGVDTGVRAVNPATTEEIPVWVADYVLGSYGTGAIMAVPAHDERDFEFAKKFGLQIVCVIDPIPAYAARLGDSLVDAEQKTFQHMEAIQKGEEFYVGPGQLMNSGKFDGLDSKVAISAIAKKIGAELKIQYRLRDWLISRQRYWGAPIPIIYCEACARLRQGFGGQGEWPVPEKDLPVELPDDVDFRPHGESPLARSKNFHNVKCPKCGQSARRESDTMDTFVDSSWYWLRYCDPHNESAAFDSKKVREWCPVNFYVGGAEHAVMHLLYARFFTKALQDMGYVNFPEPFLKLRNQGLILGEDGQKMSKSKGNVVNPDEIVIKFGADTLRLYEMFLGPLEEAKPWNTASIAGVRRFLDRVWNLCLGKVSPAASAADKLEYWVSKTAKKVTEDIEAFRFNTAIAALMEYTNYLGAVELAGEVRVKALGVLLRLLYPFAPHLTSELWQRGGFGGRVWEQPWPKYDAAALKAETITIAVQVNGKLRATIGVPAEASEEEAVAAAKAQAQVQKHLGSAEVKKTVYVPGRLVNFVTS